MGMEIGGTVRKVFETKEVGAKGFKKREFVVETLDNPKYPQVVLFEITGDKVGQLDGIEEGDEVRVDFSLRGREWRSANGDVKYFNSLDVWKVVVTKKVERQTPIVGGSAMDNVPF